MYFQLYYKYENRENFGEFMQYTRMTFVVSAYH